MARRVFVGIADVEGDSSLGHQSGNLGRVGRGYAGAGGIGHGLELAGVIHGELLCFRAHLIRHDPAFTLIHKENYIYVTNAPKAGKVP